MKTKMVVSFSLLCIISLVLEACNYPGTPPPVPPTAQSNPQVSVSIFNPYNGSVFPMVYPISLGGTYTQVGASQPGITGWEFIINGASIESTSEDAASFYGTWSPAHPGEYYVQGKVTLRDGTYAISGPVRVCVVAALEAAPGAGGYLGPCPLPTQVPDHASNGDPAIFAVAAPYQIVFSADGISCPMALPTVTFIATIDDPQDLVALVLVSFSNARGSYFNFRYLNWVTTRPVNQKEYRATVEIGDVFSADTSLHWYIQAYGRSGELLQRTQDVIAIDQAECSNHPLEIAPSATPEILHIVTPTPTPTQKIVYRPSPTRKPKKDKATEEPPLNPPEPPSQPCNPLVRVCP